MYVCSDVILSLIDIVRIQKMPPRKGPFQRKPYAIPNILTKHWQHYNEEEGDDSEIVDRQAYYNQPLMPCKQPTQQTERSPNRSDLSFSLSLTEHSPNSTRTLPPEDEDLLNGLDVEDSLDVIGHSPPAITQPHYFQSFGKKDHAFKSDMPSTNSSYKSALDTHLINPIQPISAFNLGIDHLPPSGLIVTVSSQSFIVTYHPHNLAQKSLDAEFGRPTGSAKKLLEKLKACMKSRPLQIVELYKDVLMMYEGSRLGLFLLKHNIPFKSSELVAFKEWLEQVLDACKPHQLVEWLLMKASAQQISLPLPFQVGTPHSNFWKFITALSHQQSTTMQKCWSIVVRFLAGLIDSA